MSPFVVEAAENEGYLATTTLAGTRIKTELGDLGAAISVITAKVFEDTGAVDAETILPYAVNMEVSGTQGNFANVGGAGVNRARDNGNVRNNQFSTRSRGLANLQLTRGLFMTDIPFDSYNTESITLNRGPNSLLFGASSPGGIMDQSLKLPHFGGNTGEFSVRIGERESHRETFDYNAEIIDNRLAFRVATMYDDTQHQQRPTFSRDKRIYGAIRAVLWEPKDNPIFTRTTLYGNLESGEVRSNPSKILPPGDGITNWFEAPSRALQSYTGTVFPAWVDNFTPKSTVNPLSRLNLDTPNIPFPVLQPHFIDMPYIYNDLHAQVPSVGFPDHPEINGIVARVLWNGVGGRQRVDTWGTTHFYSGQPTAYTPGFTVPVIMDRNVLDNQNMAITGTMPYRNYEFRAQSVSLEQLMLESRLSVKLDYDKQLYKNHWWDPFSTERNYDIHIDVTETLPNLQPNPNLGRAYLSDSQGETKINDRVERETSQATASYNLDFRRQDGWLKWLGRHVFTGFFTDSTIDRSNRNTMFKWIDVEGEGTNVQVNQNDRLNGGRRSVPIKIYLTPSLLDAKYTSLSDVRFTDYTTNPRPAGGDILTQIWYPFARSNPNTEGFAAPMYQNEFEVYESVTGANRTRDNFKAQTFSWQSFLFDGNLVGLIGWRKDKAKTIDNISLANYVRDVLGFSDAEVAAMTPAERVANSTDGLLPSGEFDDRRARLADEGNPAHADQISSLKKETLTWSLVGHLPENLVKLPLGSRLSAHYSVSESFVPTRARRDFDGNPLPPETGETTEYGFTVELFDRRLAIRANWYELGQKNSGAAAGISAPGAIVDWLRFWKDAEIQGIPFEQAVMIGHTTRPTLSPNITSYAEMYKAMIGLMPQTQQDLYNIRFGADGRTVISDPNPGQTVTTNADSEGFEIDIAGNITDNWRLLLNYGKQETVTNDTAIVAGLYTLAVRDNLASTGIGQLTQTPSLGEFQPMGVQWNTFQVNNLIAARAKDGTASLEQRKHRINLVSTYTFDDATPFKGFTVGGAVRWQSRVATGYENTVAPGGIVTPILDRPFLGPEELNGDAWLAYERSIRVAGRRINWKIQLNVRNLIGDDDYIPVVTNPDGTVAVVRNPPTQEIFLTNTFRF